MAQEESEGGEIAETGVGVGASEGYLDLLSERVLLGRGGSMGVNIMRLRRRGHDG